MGGSFDAVEGACDGDGIDIRLYCHHGFFLSQKDTSTLTPYPEVAGPIRVLIGDFIDEIVFLALPDSLDHEIVELGGSSKIQLDQVEVAIVHGLHIGFCALEVVPLYRYFVDAGKGTSLLCCCGLVLSGFFVLHWQRPLALV